VSDRRTNYAPKTGSAKDKDVDDHQLGGIGHAHLARVPRQARSFIRHSYGQVRCVVYPAPRDTDMGGPILSAGAYNPLVMP
jgi:hypothetical protein